MSMVFQRSDLRLLSVCGPDARSFLNGLITQRTNLAVGEGAYGALLTPQGKFLVDFPLLSMSEDKLAMGLPAQAFDDVIKRLSIFKLRSQVSLVELEGLKLVSQIGTSPLDFRDSRHSEISHDLVASRQGKSVESYHQARAELGVPEGAYDLIAGKSTLLDNGLASTIDWGKGCFIGQEVTARMRYRGLLKRVLVPYQGHAEVGSDLSLNGRVIGHIRSSYREHGFAYVLKEFVGKPLKDLQLGYPLGLSDLNL